MLFGVSLASYIHTPNCFYTMFRNCPSSLHEAGGLVVRVGMKALVATEEESDVQYKILKVSTSGLSCKPQVLYK